MCLEPWIPPCVLFGWWFSPWELWVVWLVDIVFLLWGCKPFIDDQRNVMIGVKNEEVVYVPFTKAIKNDKPINQELLSTLRRLSI